jgi:hypothetical protein
MRKHNGMKAQDVAILLKIATIGADDWLSKDLAYDMGISFGEFSYSLSRSMFAGLISDDKKVVMKESFIEFLIYGLKYVFPVKPGGLVKGIPTAHSATPLSGMVKSTEPYVWEYEKGTVRGQAIAPLYPNVVLAVQKDQALYELLALTDVLRIGRARERNMAIEEIKRRLQR